jgi:hypothetical protein
MSYKLLEEISPPRGGPPLESKRVLRIWGSRFSLCAALVRPFAWASLFLYALLQRLHEVDDLARPWRFWCSNCDLFACCINPIGPIRERQRNLKIMREFF